jgi:tetrahydromethanopterin S-methyltransferase subunit G
MTTPNSQDFLLGRIDGKLDQLLNQMSAMNTRVGHVEGRVDLLEADKDQRHGMKKMVLVVGSVVGLVSGTVVNKVWELVSPAPRPVIIAAAPTVNSGAPPQ